MSHNNKVNVLIVGGGGRESGLAYGIKKSPQAGDIYVAPGNPGTAMLGCKNIPIDLRQENFGLLADFAMNAGVSLAVIGPENALDAGIVSVLKSRGIQVFGPERPLIESSKVFAKDVMTAAGIPTAPYRVFTSHAAALDHMQEREWNGVIKASGLALGKGVRVCTTYDETLSALDDLMITRKVGDAGEQIVIEDFLHGEELSIHALCDGENAVLFPPVRDHKRLSEDPLSPMTGGMGVHGPINVTPEFMQLIKDRIVLPCLRELARRGLPFVGCLYPGLKLTKDGPMVLEFNARFGDPETQVYMRLLHDSVDLIDVFQKCTAGKVLDIDLRWKDEKCLCIVLAASGYPDNPRKGDEITLSGMYPGLTDLIVFHSDTAWSNGGLVTNGGRVLSVTRIIKAPQDLDWIYSQMQRGNIEFKGMQYRKDLGRGYGSSW